MVQFECPDCSGAGLVGAPAPAPSSGAELIAKIRAIESDDSLTERQKAKKKQQLLSGKADDEEDEEGSNKESKEEMNEVLAVLTDSFMCAFCRQLPERPVTTPCGHNFCLKCFQKWIGQGGRECVKCRCTIPSSMGNKPRINLVLIENIRHAKMLRSFISGGPPKFCHSSCNAADLPDVSYVTERAKKGGIANAKRGKDMVTTPSDHFGPISAEYDPIMNRGILVGQCFDDRHQCGQWGVHRPPVAGISGQQKCGSQSVVLSGGYVDDEDHGEWFIYTGSGGRDLSGNKRTNKEQAFDQEFKRNNEALRVSCAKGYPVRVVRSYKDERSSYAPEKGYRYDGIYRVEKCWVIVGLQGLNVCRYLFVRCDNEPAPWTSDEHGDQPRPLPTLPELQKAIDIFERTESPSWHYDEVEARWTWKKPPPPSKEKVSKFQEDPEAIIQARKAFKKAQQNSIREQILKGFSCPLCKETLTLPVTAPCAHNFCKSCLERKFVGQAFVKERTCLGGRKLRSQKNVMKCPCCDNDIADFLQNLQVNTELNNAIEKLKQKIDEMEENNEDSGLGVADSEPKNSEDAANGSNYMSSSTLKRKDLDTNHSSSTEEKHKKRACAP